MAQPGRDARIAAARRVRLLRWWGPAAALAAASLTYGLHHMPPLEDHGVSTALLVLAAAVVLSALPTALSHATERQLPLVVAVGGRSGVVRPAGSADLAFCASLQAETLPHGFFAQLGHRFVRAYLATFLASPHAIGLVVTVREAPVGMVVGVLRPGPHARWVLRRRGVRLAVLGVAALAVRPQPALRFVRTRLGRYRRALRRAHTPVPDASAASAGDGPAVLSHIAVAPGAQGAGFGAQLVAAFLGDVLAAGCERVVLTTLAGEAGAAGFYRRNGWHEDGEVIGFDGQRMIGFSLELPGSAA